MEKAIKRYFPIFVLPTMIAFTLGFIIPFAEGVYLSFCKFTTVNDAKFIGLSNYGKVFKDSTFVHAFWADMTKGDTPRAMIWPIREKSSFMPAFLRRIPDFSEQRKRKTQAALKA